MSQPLSLPYANNADGATNVSTANAWLNGTLVVTGSGATAVSVYWGPADGTTDLTAWANTNEFGFREEKAWLTTNATGLTPHTVYYYRFHATNTAGDASWAAASTNFVTLEQPQVTTNAGPTAVTAFSAVLNGNLVAGATASLSIYWGTDSNAWSATNLLGTRAEGAFSNAVSGLTPATTYYYACYAANTAGPDWSEIAPFISLAVDQPTVANTGASVVDTYTAELTGNLTAGVGASIVVYWGTNSSAWSATNLLGNRAEGPFALAISGLQASTPYAYRCFATNTAGTAWSEIAAFTTLTAPTRFWGGAHDGFDSLTLDLSTWPPETGALIMIR